DDAVTAGILAREIAQALASKERSEAEGVEARLLDLVERIDEAAQSAGSPDALVAALPELLRETFGLERTAVVSGRGREGTLVRVSASGRPVPGLAVGSAVSAARGLAAEAVSSARPVSVAEIPADERRDSLWPDSRSAVAAPISVSGEPLGALVAESDLPGA